MGNKSAIVVVLDRLSAGYVGAYGNAWVTTPTLDQLASQSFLAEFPMVATDDLRATYAQYWHGRDPSPNASGSVWSLPQACRQRSIRTLLITDEPQVADHPTAEYFDEPLLVQTPQPIRAAEAISEIHFTGLLAEAAEAMRQSQRQSQPPYLLWIHARGLAGPWDAPYALRERFADVDDPDPPTSLVPPQVILDSSTDPDLLLGYAQSYAAQVEAIDACLAPLIEWLDSLDANDQPLLILTSSRGYPLGQHGVVGGPQAKPYGDLLHVPLMLRLPQAASAAVRSQMLWQPADLAATLSDWFQCEPGPASPWSYSALPLATGALPLATGALPLATGALPLATGALPLATGASPLATGASPLATGALPLATGALPLATGAATAIPTRDRALARVGTHVALRTEHWLLVQSAERDAAEEEGGVREVYVKPDDRGEVNNVADRLPEVTAALARVGRESQRVLAAPHEAVWPPLPDEVLP